MADQSKTIRLPAHLYESYYQITNKSKELTQKYGREAEPKEIAKSLTMPIKKVREIFKYFGPEPASLSAPIKQKDGSVLSDFIKDKGSVDPSLYIEKNETIDSVYKAIKIIYSILSPKELETICLRFGIGSDNEHSNPEIGEKIGKSGETARNRADSAYKKLRRPHILAQLKLAV